MVGVFLTKLSSYPKSVRVTRIRLEELSQRVRLIFGGESVAIFEAAKQREV